MGCSGSRSGIRRGSAASSRATVSGSSRCTTPSAATLLVFASELKSLLASGLVPTELDYEAIDAYLTLGFFPAPATPLAAVKKLEPGCVLVVEDGARRAAALLELSGADARARRQTSRSGASGCSRSSRSRCDCG